MTEVIVGVVSIVAGWIFNEFATALDIKSIRRLGRRIRSIFKSKPLAIPERVTIGTLVTEMHMLDGDGTYVLDPKNLIAIYKDGTPDSPDDIADRILETERQMEQARKTNPEVWDGFGVGLRSYTVLRSTPDERRLGAKVEFHKSRYAAFRSTVRAIGTENRSDPNSIYSKHLKDKSPRDIVPFLACHVGVVITVITSDDCIIVGKRSRSTGTRPGEYDTSVVEGIDPTRDANESGDTATISIVEVMQRGCVEELGFSPEEQEIEILGFGVDMRFYQFNFIGLVRSKLTYAQIAMLRSEAKDRWETEIEPIRLNIIDVLDVIRTRQMWSTAQVALYWAIRRHFGKRDVEIQIEQRMTNDG